MIATATANHSSPGSYTPAHYATTSVERSAGGRLVGTGGSYGNAEEPPNNNGGVGTSSSEAFSSSVDAPAEVPRGNMSRSDRERSRMFVRALYDYSTDDPTSLSFHAGDVIQVLKQLDSGWWDGIVNGQRGWFPSNYCNLIPASEHLNGHGVLPSDDSDDLEEDDSYDEYDDASNSSDSEHGLTSPGLPMEGTNLKKNDIAGLWVPQATPHGRLFYFNVDTGESRQDLPLETPTSTTEMGPRDRSKSIPDSTRPPPEILAGGYEREEPLFRANKEVDEDSASDKEGEMPGVNGSNNAAVSAPTVACGIGCL
jgi:hypothetical protein